MTLYLTDNTPPEEIEKARASGHIYAVKLYPAGATTNSHAGVTDLVKVQPTLAKMAELGMPLCIHGEVTDKAVDIFEVPSPRTNLAVLQININLFLFAQLSHRIALTTHAQSLRIFSCASPHTHPLSGSARLDVRPPAPHHTTPSSRLSHRTRRSLRPHHNQREPVFLDRHLEAIVKGNPGLKVILEHITTKEAVAFVNSHGPNVAATITAHHLLYNRNAIFEGGLRPHMYV